MWVIIAVFVSLLTAAYLIIISSITKGWKALPEWDTLKKTVNTKVSVLIAARNEEKNIEATLRSITNQDYPAELFEIIVIDDHSTDRTAALVKDFPATNISLIDLAKHVAPGSTQSFKKKAIEVAIGQAKGSLIVTTDADCLAMPHWLRYIVSYYEIHRPKIIAAPVVFTDEHTLFQQFQSLDFIGMMGVTGAGIHKKFLHMCNGANLAYEKAVFNEVNGFEGVDHLASGDDMLLMHKVVQRYPDQVAYLKQAGAVVTTTPKRSIQAFLNQRLRWATKTTSYQEKQVTIIWGLVWLFSVSIVLTGLASVFYPFLLWLFLLQFSIKAITDYLFLGEVARFFGRGDLMRIGVFGAAVFWEIWYVVTVGLLGSVKAKYEWKGRTVK